ncbi:MAG: cation diffusion facilitator family transporter [Alphaproteobacteria bacterium]|nr:cation diffusion facilitator family transporter [Alphaproteobacteria bacterium]
MIDKTDILAIDNSRLRRLATCASISVAAVLIAAKLIAWRMTDSVALLTSLFDSTFDLFASLITAYGVARALRPPDRGHRFGHGKAEPLAALVQAVFIIGSSVLLVYEAASRLYHPRAIAHEGIGYGVMALALALTFALVRFQDHVASKTGSVAIRADRLHYVGDLAVNLAVMAAFALQQLTEMVFFDSLFAFGIALGLMVSAVHILRQALLALTDAELPEREREKIRAVVLCQPGVRGVHDMRTRSDSDRVFIELHVEMDGHMTLRDAHELTEKISAALLAVIPNADILVHQDPVGIEEFRLDAQIEKEGT